MVFTYNHPKCTHLFNVKISNVIDAYCHFSLGEILFYRMLERSIEEEENKKIEKIDNCVGTRGGNSYDVDK